MQTNEDTYLNEPEEKEEGKSILKTFNDSFKIDEYTEEIARLLNTNSQLQEMMNKLGIKIMKASQEVAYN
jgi:hypothetical protein